MLGVVRGAHNPHSPVTASGPLPPPHSIRSGAAQAGSLAVLTALLDAGAAINDSDDNEQSALHSAAMAGHLDVVKLLLRE